MADDKPECGPQCDGNGHWPHSPDCTWQCYAESIREWLVANGVDWDHRTPMWPEIEISNDGEVFWVEQFHLDRHGRHELMHGLGLGAGTLTRRVQFRQTVAIDPELLEAYLHSRPRALEAAKLEAVKQVLQQCPPAVSLNGGETLLFATRDRSGLEAAQTAQKALQDALPGVAVRIVIGVDTIMAGPGPVSL